MTVGRPEYDRRKITEDIIKVMKLEPFISLNEISKRVKHSPPTVTNIYSKVRRSKEWREWVSRHGRTG